MGQQEQSYGALVHAAMSPDSDISVYGADNVASVYSAERANLYNLAIANQTNAMNYRMAKEKNDLDYKIYQETNEYNKPVNQVQRFIDAGINPVAAVSSGSIGSGNAANYQTAQATAIPGAPMVAPHFLDSQTPVWAGVNAVGNQVKNIADTILDFGRLSNETDSKDSNIAFNRFKMAESEANTNRILAETKTLIPLQARSLISDMKRTESEIELNKNRGKVYDSQVELNHAQIKQWDAVKENMLQNVRLAWANYNLGRERFDSESNYRQNEFSFEKEKFYKNLGVEEKKVEVDSHSNPWKSAINLFKGFLGTQAVPSSYKHQSDAALVSTFEYLSTHPAPNNVGTSEQAEIISSLYGELARRYMYRSRSNVNSANTPTSVENPSPINSSSYDDE